jgi:NitT/TauT family transport system substrate-binding protein
MDYSKDLTYTRDPKAENMQLAPAEIWHADKGIVSYDSVADMLANAAKVKQQDKLRSSYVYDNTTGLKIFAKIAYYVKSKDGRYTAFMRKPDALRFAADKGGELVDAITTDAGKPFSLASLN